MKPRKEKPAHRTPVSTGNDSQSSNTRSSESQAGKHIWRDHFEPHPAALVFHRYTTDEDWHKMKEDLEANKRLQARIVTVHVADDSGGKVYIADGITRLDAMEELGWQIVDEHGNWMGAVEGMVDHRRNYTHEQVADLVISLNASRRHMSKQDVVKAIDEALKLRPVAEGNEFLINDYEKIPRPRGRPRDEHKAEVVKAAAKHGISKPTVEKALADQPERPKIRKRKDTLLNGEDSSTVFDREKFNDLVWKRFSQMVRGFDSKREEEVQLEVVNRLLGKSKGGKEIKPESVTYADGSTRKIRDVIFHRREEQEREREKIAKNIDALIGSRQSMNPSATA